MGEREKGESAVAYHAFTVYRDMPPAERSLRALRDLLSEQNPNTKKKSLGVLGEWSSRYHWQERVSAWDIENSRQAASVAAQQRQKEIEQFIQADFIVSDVTQRLTVRILKELSDKGETVINVQQLRLALMAYKEGRSNLKDLIGIMEE